MKKTIFSLAFVAASGVYVAAANHVFTAPEDASLAVATNTAASPQPVLPAAPPASAVPMSTPLPLVTTVPQIVALADPLPTPPLPRARPTITPLIPPAVEPAASTDTAASGASGYRDGTYTGADENAYYGRVQVEVTVTNHQITNVRALDYPHDRRTSRYINGQALPLLKQEVIAADSANVDVVSGATLTSEAYIRSLGNALAQAGGANA